MTEQEKLFRFIDRNLRYATDTICLDDRKSFYIQSFGAVQFYLELFPEDEAFLYNRWMNHYRPQFERLIRDAAT